MAGEVGMLDGPILSIDTASTKTRSSSAEVPGVYMFLVEAEEGRTRPETRFAGVGSCYLNL